MKRGHYNHIISPKQPTRNQPHQHTTGLKQPPLQPQRTTARTPAARRSRRPFPAKKRGRSPPSPFCPPPLPFFHSLHATPGGETTKAREEEGRTEGVQTGGHWGDFKGGQGSGGPHHDVAVRWVRARSGTWRSLSRRGSQGRRHASGTLGSRRLPSVQGKEKGRNRPGGRGVVSRPSLRGDGGRIGISSR